MYSREKLSITNVYFNTDSTALAACIYAQVNMCVCDSRCVLADACTHVSACKNTSKINLRNSPLSILPSFFWDTLPILNQGPSLSGSCFFSSAGWPEIPKLIPCLFPQCRDNKCITALGSSRWLFWGMNLGLHARMLNNLQTEPSAQTSFVPS